jgi:hypothetical protein
MRACLTLLLCHQMRAAHAMLSAPVHSHSRAVAVSPRRPALTLRDERTDEELVDETRGWLDDFIIRHQICPFAAGVRKETRILVERGDPASAARVVAAELEALQSVDPAVPATTLLLLPAFDAFEDLMSFQAEMEVCHAGAPEVQLLAFHPAATFGESAHDPADLSMRSPHPMLHLLRDSDVEAAEGSWLEQHAPAPAPSIQERNAALLRGIGYASASAQAAAAVRLYRKEE